MKAKLKREAARGNSLIVAHSFNQYSMEVARIVEAQIRSLRERDFAVAAEASGASDARVMFRELLPNAIAPIVVAATLNVAHAILAESYMSFLVHGI